MSIVCDITEYRLYFFFFFNAIIASLKHQIMTLIKKITIILQRLQQIDKKKHLRFLLFLKQIN